MPPSLNISIIGAGQIGSRHLQALAHLQEPAQIQLVDPSQKSLEVACERFYSVYKKEGADKIVLQAFNEIQELDEHQDVTIVATDATVRSQIIKELLLQKKPRALILEKVLFQSEKEYLEIDYLLRKNNIPTWVNCVLRATDFFLKLKNSLNSSEQIHMRVEGMNWGLASNSIHFLDLFSFFTGCQDFAFTKVKFNHVEPYFKRPNSKEFLGEMVGKNSRDHNLFLSCKKNNGESGSKREKTIQIDNGNIHHSVIIRSDHVVHKTVSGKNETEEVLPMPVQSQITNQLVESIIHKGSCGLPIYADSMVLHLCLIRTFLNHLIEITGKNVTRCPIT
jgi:predicted dehydrogenase